MAIKLEQKFIEMGYATREFGYARREVILEPNEIDLVNKAVFGIWMRSIRETQDLDAEDLRSIEKLTKESFTFMDVLLVSQAKKNGCSFFITKDRKLKEIKKLSKLFKIKIIGIKEFLDKLR